MRICVCYWHRARLWAAPDPRPRSATDGQLAVAKFPHQGDEINAVRWEAVALTLAAKAAIPVPAWRVEDVSGKPVLLLRRFDRSGGVRVPFLSAMSMLGANDNEMRSYLEFVDALRQHGAAPKEDMRALWRRIVFSILISNTDDHLRNHGFLYAGPDGWRQAPAYDLNPVRPTSSPAFSQLPSTLKTARPRWTARWRLHRILSWIPGRPAQSSPKSVRRWRPGAARRPASVFPRPRSTAWRRPLSMRTCRALSSHDHASGRPTDEAQRSPHLRSGIVIPRIRSATTFFWIPLKTTCVTTLQNRDSCTTPSLVTAVPARW